MEPSGDSNNKLNNAVIKRGELPLLHSNNFWEEIRLLQKHVIPFVFSFWLSRLGKSLVDFVDIGSWWNPEVTTYRLTYELSGINHYFGTSVHELGQGWSSTLLVFINIRLWASQEASSCSNLPHIFDLSIDPSKPGKPLNSYTTFCSSFREA